MVGLVLSALTTLAPKISAPQDIKYLLLYLVRSCALHQPCKPLIAAMNKRLVYSMAMKVLVCHQIEHLDIFFFFSFIRGLKFYDSTSGILLMFIQSSSKFMFGLSLLN